MTGISYNRGVAEGQKDAVRRIFQSVGSVVDVSEGLMDALDGDRRQRPGFVAARDERFADGCDQENYCQRGAKFGFDKKTAALLAQETGRRNAEDIEGQLRQGYVYQESLLQGRHDGSGHEGAGGEGPDSRSFWRRGVARRPRPCAGIIETIADTG